MTAHNLEPASPPVVRRSTAILVSVATFVVGATAATVVTIVAGGGAVFAGNGSNSRSGSQTSTLPVQVSFVPPGPQTTRSVPPAGGIGQPVTNGGIKLTINAVSISPVVPRGRGGDQPPRAGAKIVRVDTTVDNVGTESIDLTCSYPIANKLWDAQKRQFDSVDKLYDIPGNPECNDSIQPGFSSPMTYMYEVPQDAVIEFFGFADSNVNFGADTTFISIAPVQ